VQSLLTGVRHQIVDANGIRVHLAEMGPEDGPVVLLCHGFPESWYSWRHQLKALGDAGYRAVAPDMRGYGQTDAPADGRAYTQLHHVGDMVGVLDAIGAAQAVIVGHDWGAPVAWNGALLRPDRFRAVAAFSVPWAPRASVAPTRGMKAHFGDRWFYFLYFQEPGKAEAELEGNIPSFMRGILHTASGEASPNVLDRFIGGPKTGKLLEHLAQPEELPSWLLEEDLAYYVAEFERTGLRGPLSWYRCADLSWELLGAFDGRRIEQPALFVGGDRDLTPLEAIEAMAQTVPGLRRKLVLPRCGHWTQQERPAEVNEALLGFLAEI
jgi:pimeloyl-ACP methyl ester carboxylesterase